MFILPRISAQVRLKPGNQEALMRSRDPTHNASNWFTLSVVVFVNKNNLWDTFLIANILSVTHCSVRNILSGNILFYGHKKTHNILWCGDFAYGVFLIWYMF